VGHRAGLDVLETRKSLTTARVFARDHPVCSLLSLLTMLPCLLLLGGDQQLTDLPLYYCYYYCMLGCVRLRWQFSACHSRCVGLNTGLFLCDLWWTEWHWDTCCSQCFSLLPLPISVIPPVLCSHLFIFNTCCVILAVGSIIKWQSKNLSCVEG
jgi:hypothetical protein